MGKQSREANEPATTTSMKSPRQTGTGARSGKSFSRGQRQQQQEVSGQSSPAHGGQSNGDERIFRGLSKQQVEDEDHRLRLSRVNLSEDDEDEGQTSGSSGHGESGSSSSDEEAPSESSSSGVADGRESSTESLSASSGRSSSAEAEMKEEASWCLVPARLEALELIERVRVRFIDSLEQGAEQDDKYEQLDVEELRKPLPSHLSEQLHQSLAVRLISRFIDFDKHLQPEEAQESTGESSGGASGGSASEKVVAEVTEKLTEFLHFRHHYQLSHVLVEDFSKEVYQLHGIFPFGHDKNQLPVLYLRARVHRRWSAKLDEAFKRYVAWQVDLITKSNHGAQVAKSITSKRNIKDGSFCICFDCLNVSYSCVDMDFLGYLVKILVHYYPTYCRYALCVDLPWLFRSVWRLVKSWLPEDAQNNVHLITSKQLPEFIDADQIPNSMKINELQGDKKSARGKHRLPAYFEQLMDFDAYGKRLNLSSSEIKQFKSHIEKVLKEYEQLGAI